MTSLPSIDIKKACGHMSKKQNEILNIFAKVFCETLPKLKEIENSRHHLFIKIFVATVNDSIFNNLMDSILERKENNFNSFFAQMLRMKMLASEDNRDQVFNLYFNKVHAIKPEMLKEVI